MPTELVGTPEAANQPTAFVFEEFTHGLMRLFIVGLSHIWAYTISRSSRGSFSCMTLVNSRCHAREYWTAAFGSALDGL
jgi:hypothetical protein